MRNIRNNKKMAEGITLIALVVTIIVLLILAGISIQMLTGDNGILTRAGEAKDVTEQGQEKEIITLAYNAALAKKINGGNLTKVVAEDLNAELTNYGATANGSSPIIVTFNNGNSYKINENGEISSFIPLPTIQIGETAPANSNATYSDGVNSVTIPSGFTVSGITGESTISNGLVIYDLEENTITDWNSNANNIKSSYNQFVWVPVPDKNDFVRYKEYYSGSLNGTVLSCSEPAQENYRYPTEISEYEEMYKSVTENKGFYVARYEASHGSNGAESKQGKDPWRYIAWGNSTTEVGTTGALYQSQKMYSGKTKYAVKSTLIYGVQWDAIMLWIDPSYKSGTCNTTTSFVANSSGKGYFNKENPTITGSNDDYSVKNIYDLAGNLFEWTMESYNSSNRIIRGANFRGSGDRVPASARSGASAENNTNDYIGFRPILYL